MGKRDPEPELEPEAPTSGAHERMIRLQRRACAFKVLARAGIEPIPNPSPFYTVEEADALEKQVAEAGLTEELEASYKNREWTG